MANQCKFYKVVRQVSYDSGVTWVNIGETQKGDLYEYDSAECGAVTEYRWVDVTGAYTCEGTTKYQKTKRQVSTDGGTTWSDVSPIEYGKGQVIDYHSTDCGYVPSPYESQYFTISLRESTTIAFCGSTDSNSLSYSRDGGATWTPLANGAQTPRLSAGEKIMWKGNCTPIGPTNPQTEQPEGRKGIGVFYAGVKKADVEGNIMSLLFGDNFIGKTNLTGYDWAFASLFCNKNLDVINANNLILPATTLSTGCYYGMFQNSLNLVSIPELPATTLAPYCYAWMYDLTNVASIPAGYLPATTLAPYCYTWMFAITKVTSIPSGLLPSTTLAVGCYCRMFESCKNLETVPIDLLPATTLADRCYLGMFASGYASGAEAPRFTTAPDLPAPTLTYLCYWKMFDNHIRLTSVKCLATDISATYCTEDWLKNVSSSGTFTKASSMESWTRGKDGIPTNWSVQNA